MSPRIDIVITHVDGSAPGYEALCRKYAVEYVPSHVRDLGELRYVLRSIEKHAPWGQVVLVVQNRDHLPAWLDRRSVRVVLHDEFIPGDLLPTFHWATIAAHLYRIPGLAERFVYWEDDTLVGSPLSAADLYGEDGLLALKWATTPIPFGLGRFLGQYQRNLEETRRALARVLGRPVNAFLYPHAPLPSTRASWAAFHEAALDEPSFSGTVTRRSRGNEAALATVDPVVMYANWLEARLRGRGVGARYGLAVRWLMERHLGNLLGRTVARALRCEKFAVVNDERRMARHMTRLRDMRVRQGGAVFFNLNDEAYDGRTDTTLNPVSAGLLDQTLAVLFPTRSRYEADDETPSAGP